MPCPRRRPGLPCNPGVVRRALRPFSNPPPTHALRIVPDVDRRGVVSSLLARLGQGEESAVGDLFQLVYRELRELAAGQLARERPGHTLQPTALVHEAFMKLSGTAVGARDRGHFIGIAARAMRQVLVDYARRRGAGKRGRGWDRTTLRVGGAVVDVDPDELLDLDRALETLDERQRRVVELRYFAGLEELEVARLLGVTERTVRRDWVKARAWLYAALYPAESSSPAEERG
jgi:RNA polymerase sigma factor (TIGR02999 family)